MELKIGDVVQLKSGGPLMTVSAIQETTAHCLWFSGAEVKGNNFKLHTLAKYEERR